MPPQNNQVPPSSGPSFSPDSMKNNPRLIPTIKTFAIYGAILYVVNSAVGMIVSSLHFSAYYYGGGFSISVLINAIVTGAIGFAIGGAVFSFIYDPIKNWVKGNAFLSKYIHDMFTLFWKPYLVGFIIYAIFGLVAVLSLPGFFVGWLIGSVVGVGVYYWYAKTISSKLSSLYPW